MKNMKRGNESISTSEIMQSQIPYEKWHSQFYMDCTAGIEESEWKDIYIFCFSTSFHFQQRERALCECDFFYMCVYLHIMSIADS